MSGTVLPRAGNPNGIGTNGRFFFGRSRMLDRKPIGLRVWAEGPSRSMCRAEDGNGMLIESEDAGPGILHEVRGRVFEEFVAGVCGIRPAFRFDDRVA